MKVVVTGGAGYIGSITSTWLLECGHQVTIIDDLSTGHREAVPAEAELIEARVQDTDVMTRVLEGADAAIHFASLSLVGESIQNPEKYHRENVSSGESLLDAMARAGVPRLVFSSSAAVYGEPAVDVIQEDEPCKPVNPYGETKVLVEQAIDRACAERDLGAVSLRYFNACGAHGGRGEHHDPETHLLPRLCDHLLGRFDGFAIHGDDYPTPDGTAVRDYVHVFDLARAHVSALETARAGQNLRINLGTGQGASVREVIEVAEAVAGKRVQGAVGPRRAGDPPRLVASRQAALDKMGWEPTHSDLSRILSDAYAWHRDHPQGYGSVD